MPPFPTPPAGYLPRGGFSFPGTPGVRGSKPLAFGTIFAGWSGGEGNIDGQVCLVYPFGPLPARPGLLTVTFEDGGVTTAVTVGNPVQGFPPSGPPAESRIATIASTGFTTPEEYAAAFSAWMLALGASAENPFEWVSTDGAQEVVVRQKRVGSHGNTMAYGVTDEGEAVPVNLLGPFTGGQDGPRIGIGFAVGEGLRALALPTTPLVYVPQPLEAEA